MKKKKKIQTGWVKFSSIVTLFVYKHRLYNVKKDVKVCNYNYDDDDDDDWGGCVYIEENVLKIHKT